MALDILLLLACGYFAGRIAWDLVHFPMSGWGFSQCMLLFITLFLLALGAYEAVRVIQQLRQKRAAKRTTHALPPSAAEPAQQDTTNAT